MVIDLIGLISRKVIGLLSVKPSRMRFDPSIVSVNQSFIVSPVIVVVG